jgi:hypothetical protein
MLKRQVQIFAVLPLISLLCSCSPPGTTQVKVDNGTEVNVSNGGQAAYPANIPIQQYPGSFIIVNANTNNSADKSGMKSMVEMTTKDPSPTVSSFYKSKLAEGGWTIDQDMNMNEMVMMHATKGSQQLSLQIMKDTAKNESVIIITLG